MNKILDQTKFPVWPLFVLVFITGACILVIEIIGTRILSPFFGSGIYTWTSLISTTLAALSLGYAIGGRIVDKYPFPAILFSICFLAGVWTVITPWLAGWMLPDLVNLPDMRIAILISSIVLFFPNLFLLGAIGPFVIRLITVSASTTGTDSGLVFAVSTTGSLLAAILSGFILMPNYGVISIFNSCGIILISVSAVGFLYSRHYMVGALSIIVIIISAYNLSIYQADKVGELKVLHSEASFYGDIQVVESHGFKALMVDGVGQNYVTKSNYTTPYIDFISALPMLNSTSNHIDNAVVIGAGAGELPMLLTRAGIDVDVVDINEKIFQVAKKYFDFDLSEDQIFVDDGRQFFSHTKKTYDFIVLDAFNSDLVAWHLLSKEALATAKARLSDEGLLAINITSMLGGEDVASVQATLKTVFPYVRLFQEDLDEGLISFVFTASSQPINLSIETAKLSQIQEITAKEFISAEQGDLGGSIILSDNYNPVSYQRRHVQLEWRKEMRDFLGKEQSLLLYN